MLEIMETLKHFRFMPQEINPSKLAIIINEAHIKGFATNKGGRRAPYIREYKI
jgi:phosphoenolpyruvate-protein kinase (PTS system EI component)